MFGFISVGATPPLKFDDSDIPSFKVSSFSIEAIAAKVVPPEECVPIAFIFVIVPL